MTRATQKEAERRHLQIALELLGEQDTQVTEGERPDFFVTFASGRQVGVEVVQLFDPQLRSVVNGVPLRKFKERICAGLDTAERPATVVIGVRGRAWLSKSTKEKERNAVADLVVRRIVEGDISDQLPTLGQQELRQMGIPWLRALLVQPPTRERTEVSFTFRTEHFGSPDWALVRARMDAKHEKLAVYRSEWQGEVWLLMVTGEHLAQPVDSRWLRDGSVKTAFDRALVLDLAARRLVDVATNGS